MTLTRRSRAAVEVGGVAVAGRVDRAGLADRADRVAPVDHRRLRRDPKAGDRLGRGWSDRVGQVVPVDLIVGRADPEGLAGAGRVGLAAAAGRSSIRWWA